MPFIGTTPAQGFVSSVNKQSFTANGSTTSFTLTHPVSNANDLEVFVGNVRQEPTAAYSASGTTLDFGSGNAPPNGVNLYVIYKNLAQVTTTPPDGSVSNAKITGMASSKLTGALPALDGSALTSVTGAITWQTGAYVSTSANTTAFTSLPAKNHFIAVWHDLSCDGSNWSYIRLGDATGGYATSGYAHSTAYTSGNSYYQNAANVAAHDLGVSLNNWSGVYSGVFQCWNTIGNIWSWHLHNQRTDNGANAVTNTGSVALSGQLDRIAFLENAANWTSGAIRLGYM